MKTFSSVAVALGALIPVGAKAQNKAYSGNDIFDACKSSFSDDTKEIYKQGLCNGAIASIFFFSGNFSDDLRFCPPENSTARQATKIVVNYMDKNPDKLHQFLFILATDALRAAWPCRN